MAINSTNITPPRVPIVDERTGLISREWYRFFLNLFVLTGSGSNFTSLSDLQVGPPPVQIEDVTSRVPGEHGVTPSQEAVVEQIAEIEKQINGLLMQTRPELGTMSQLQQNNVPWLTFDTTPEHTPDSVGTTAWNTTDQTLDVKMEYGVTQQVGQETYARVSNQTGSLIPNGSVVGFAGATSNALLVSPYIADGSQPSLYIIGVMTHDLPDSGEKGYCTTWGFVRDLDTSAFSAGDVLYVSTTTPGAFTNVKPTAPNNVIPIAACVISDATNGVIFVRPTIEQMQYYGEFSATTDQLVAAINTAYAVSFNSTSISNGVTIGTPTSRIVVPASGLYRVQVNIQIASASAAAKNLWCWFRKNGTDITNSARITTSDINNGFISMTHDCTVSLAANDYVEVMYAADSTNIFLDATAATAFAPGSPAVQIAVTQSQQ